MLGAFGLGGTDNPLIMNLVPSYTHVDTFAATLDTEAAHIYSVDYTCINSGAPVQAGFGVNAIQNVFTRNTSLAGATSHAITITGAVGTNPGADNWSPLYVNAIRCSKN